MTKTHCMRGTPTYLSWRAMKSRCLNPNDPAWSRYGGRGITICDSWLQFEGFLADMGVRPEGKELDRVDVNGGYEPSNCRWATRLENARNKRGTKQLTAFGVTATLAEHAEKHGVRHDTVRYRMRVMGVSLETALTASARSLDDLVAKRKTLRASHKTYSFGGEQLLLSEVADRIGVPRDTLSKRLETHDFERAVSMPYKPWRNRNANA